jgi:hypothetical protein
MTEKGFHRIKPSLGLDRLRMHGRAQALQDHDDEGADPNDGKVAHTGDRWP